MQKGWGIRVRRPFVWLLLPYIAGILVSYFAKVPAVVAWATMAGLLVFGFWIIKMRLRNEAFFCVILLFFLFFGWSRGLLSNYAVNPMQAHFNQALLWTGTISGLPQHEADRDIYVLKVKSAKIRLTVYSDTRGTPPQMVFRPGDTLLLEGQLTEPPGQRNPKAFDYRRYLAGRGIYGLISTSVNEITLVQPGSRWTPMGISYTFRKKAGDILALAGDKEGNILKAMILGERHLIPPEVRQDLQRSGLSHLLAISGLHVGFLVLLLSKLVVLLRVETRRAFFLQATLLIFYCGAVGFTASVLRAVVMALFYLGGKQLGRRVDLLNSMAGAAWLILLIRPLEVVSIGFLLSFTAVTAIALLQKPIQKALGFLPKTVASVLSVTLAAQIGTMPLVAYAYNIASPIGLLTNPIAATLAGLAVIGGFLFIPIGLMIPWVAGIFMPLLRFPVGGLLMLGDISAVHPWAAFRVVSPSLFTIGIYYMILWILSTERPTFIVRPSYWTGCLIMFYLTTRILLPYFTPQTLQIVFLDVGQGDSIYIKTPDRHHILIDAGGRALRTDYGWDPGEAIVLPFLLKNGTANLDLVMMSHGHEDHIGGLVSVVDQLRIGAIMEYPPLSENLYYQEIKDAVMRKNIPVLHAVSGQTYRVGADVLLHILFPLPDERLMAALAGDNENNHSIVVLVEYQETAVLLTGDIEARVERYLVDKIPRTVDILKAAHHGSKTSSTPEWLSAVAPKIAVIQVGKNTFGHPSPEVVDRYDADGILLYRNDTNGAVICTYRKGQWDIKTMQP